MTHRFASVLLDVGHLLHARNRRWDVLGRSRNHLAMQLDHGTIVKGSSIT